MTREDKFTILIVDDEEFIREALALNFQMSDYHVLMANGAIEALEIMDNEKVDFIISDVRMREGDGWMLLKGLQKREGPNPNIIMMSGDCELTREEAIELKAIDLLPKPLNLEQLEKCVESYSLKSGHC